MTYIFYGEYKIDYSKSWWNRVSNDKATQESFEEFVGQLEFHYLTEDQIEYYVQRFERGHFTRLSRTCVYIDDYACRHNLDLTKNSPLKAESIEEYNSRAWLWSVGFWGEIRVYEYSDVCVEPEHIMAEVKVSKNDQKNKLVIDGITHLGEPGAVLYSSSQGRQDINEPLITHIAKTRGQDVLIRDKLNGVRSTIIRFAAEAFSFNEEFNSYRPDLPVEAYERVGTSYYQLFPYVNLVREISHWVPGSRNNVLRPHPWKPYDLSQCHSSEGVVILHQGIEYRAKRVPTIEAVVGKDFDNASLPLGTTWECDAYRTPLRERAGKSTVKYPWTKLAKVLAFNSLPTCVATGEIQEIVCRVDPYQPPQKIGNNWIIRTPYIDSGPRVGHHGINEYLTDETKAMPSIFSWFKQCTGNNIWVTTHHDRYTMWLNDGPCRVVPFGSTRQDLAVQIAGLTGLSLSFIGSIPVYMRGNEIVTELVDIGSQCVPRPTYRKKDTLSVKVIIYTPAGIVLVRERNKPLDLPGGRLHENETVIDGARREVLEETGLHVNPKIVGMVHFGSYHTVVLSAVADTVDNDPYVVHMPAEELDQRLSECVPWMSVMLDAEAGKDCAPMTGYTVSSILSKWARQRNVPDLVKQLLYKNRFLDNFTVSWSDASCSHIRCNCVLEIKGKPPPRPVWYVRVIQPRRYKKNRLTNQEMLERVFLYLVKYIGETSHFDSLKNI